MNNYRTFLVAILCFCLITLAACGGGGGETTNSQTSSNPSVAGSDIPDSAENCNSRDTDGGTPDYPENCNPVDINDAPPAFIKVTLPKLDGTSSEIIEIPNGRPVYALLVSGFHQNKNLDMFHFYNFARCLLEKGAYVHYAWWNNLLAPYMEKPLHDPDSVPSTKIVPYHDM
ncbi:MAG: hypothetical protein DRR42_21745, partial [Gammaproteobacteria bacterium]